MAKCTNCDYPYASGSKCPNCGSSNPKGKMSIGGVIVLIFIIYALSKGCAG